MSIITALNLNKACRYYICNKSEHKCYKVIKQEYNPKDSNSCKYCREFEILDKLRLSMDNLDCKIHIIKKE